MSCSMLRLIQGSHESMKARKRPSFWRAGVDQGQAWLLPLSNSKGRYYLARFASESHGRFMCSLSNTTKKPDKPTMYHMLYSSLLSG